MFIKKDLRKIPRILADAAPDLNFEDEHEPAAKRSKSKDVLKELRLSRRISEFQGSLKILCQPDNAPSLQHLVSLSLYDCQISSLDGIGILGSELDNGGQVCCPQLEELNVGRNPITTLPQELSNLVTLKHFWCDDCQLEGSVPTCLVEMENLETLRLSHNKLTSIPSSIGNLTNLITLCLDGNEITDIPPALAKLDSLETLLLRNNKLSSLPEGVPGATMENLALLQVSSNQLQSLPKSTAECASLEYLYANSNHLTHIPKGLDTLPLLKRATFSHNRIQELSPAFVEKFGEPVENGKCEKEPTCVVTLAYNPVTDRTKASEGGEPKMTEGGAEDMEVA